jgi:hypothetical protein
MIEPMTIDIPSSIKTAPKKNKQASGVGRVATLHLCRARDEWATNFEKRCNGISGKPIGKRSKQSPFKGLRVRSLVSGKLMVYARYGAGRTLVGLQLHEPHFTADP